VEVDVRPLPLQNLRLHAPAGEARCKGRRGLTTGKGFLSRVVFVVAWARNHLQANCSIDFRFQIQA
jgi:hypothetical protein